MYLKLRGEVQTKKHIAVENQLDSEKFEEGA